MNLILIAAPAAGKGTIAQILNDKFGIEQVSAGELLRAVDRNTDLGKKISEIQEKGLLVDNKITAELMKNRILELHSAKGVVLDGYPRLMEQVYDLEEIQKEINLGIDYVIYLNVKYEDAYKRTLGRRICTNCKKSYNVLTGVNTPKIDEECDDCHIKLVKRSDDNETSLKTRFEFFKEKTLPVVEHYRRLGKLIEIDATKDIDEICKRLFESLGVVNDKN